MQHAEGMYGEMLQADSSLDTWPSGGWGEAALPPQPVRRLGDRGEKPGSARVGMTHMLTVQPDCTCVLGT